MPFNCSLGKSMNNTEQNGKHNAAQQKAQIHINSILSIRTRTHRIRIDSIN